jgi:hypothetical protein
MGQRCVRFKAFSAIGIRVPASACYFVANTLMIEHVESGPAAFHRNYFLFDCVVSPGRRRDLVFSPVK